jgi:hypothetical protein
MASYQSTTPDYNDYDYRGYIADGTTTAISFTVVPGITYYFRICQAATPSTDGCLVLSNVVSYTFSSTLVLAVPSVSGGSVTLNWSGPTGTPYTFDKYVVFRSGPGSTSASVVTTLDSSVFTYGDTVSADGSYNYYIGAYDTASSGYRGFSNQQTVSVTLP